MRTYFGVEFRRQCQLRGNRQLFQLLERQDHFEHKGPYIAKPVCSQHFMAIGIEQSILGQSIRVWLTLLHRNSREWTLLCGDFRLAEATFLTALLEKEQPSLLEYAGQPQHEPDQTEIPLEEAYVPWLSPLGFESGTGEELLFETQVFSQQMSHPDLRSYRSQIRELLSGPVRQGSSDAPPDPLPVRQISYGELTLHYLMGGSFKSEWRILLSVQKHVPAKSLESVYQDQKTTLETLQALASMESTSSPDELYDQVAQHTRRVYPTWLLWDQDDWERVITEKESNQTLSAEELKIVHALTGTSGQMPSYRLPLFIQGRAGSGKTTLLAHVFARYWSHKLKHGLPGAPLYLALNPHLLKRAVETVEKLIGHHAELSTRHSQPPEAIALETQTEAMSELFRTPRQLALNMVAQHSDERVEVAERFLDASYVSYTRFRTLFNRDAKGEHNRPLLFRPPKPIRVTAAKAWFILRAFIKGWDEERILTPEDFGQLPAKSQRLVNTELYALVYTQVWEKWYKRLGDDHGLWDDQDLYRYVLTEVPSAPTFTAIFCDEAQDLTPVESRFLASLSHFNRYPVPEHLPNAVVPILFGGDPFQTVNPSGFRIEVIKDHVVEALGGAEKHPRFTLDEAELEYNYRAQSKLVRFSNLIQAWRCGLFSLTATPQKVWRQDRGTPVLLYILGEDIPDNEPCERLQNRTLILDCLEGSEADAIQNDPFLRLQHQEGLLQEGMVFSPSTIKGLERARVVLYGFGQAYVSLFGPLGRTPPKNELLAEAEYFWNRLYVAVTRATESLILLDTQAGVEHFWGKFYNLTQLPKGTKNTTHWLENSDPLERGTLELLTLQEAPDPVLFARELRQEGEQREDAILLRRAVACFDSLGDRDEALECEAQAEALEGNPLDAARLWEKRGSKQALLNARELYWQACHWEGLIRIRKPCPLTQEQEMLAEYFLAETRSEARKPRSFSSLALSQICGALQRWLDSGRKASLFSPPWRALLEHWKRLLDAEEQHRTLDRASLEMLANTLERLADSGPGTARLAARTSTLLGQWSRARKLWEKSGDVDHPRYYRVRTELETPPASLEWWSRLHDDDRILQLWQQNRSPEDAWLKWVEPALERRRDWSTLIDMQLRKPKAAEKAVDVLKRALPGLAPDRQDALILRVLEALGKRTLVYMALELAEHLCRLKPGLPGAARYAAEALEIWRKSTDVLSSDRERSSSDRARLLFLIQIWKVALLDPNATGQPPLEDLVRILEKLEHSEDKHGEDKHGEDKHGEDKHGEDKHGEDKHGEDKHGEDERRTFYLEASQKGNPTVRAGAQKALERLERLAQERLRRDEGPSRVQAEPEVIKARLGRSSAGDSSARPASPEPESPPPVSARAPLELSAVRFGAFEQLRVQNFKAYEDARLDFDALTVLVGRNGAGKSSLFHALDFMREALSDSLENAVGVRGELVSLLWQGGREPARRLALSIQVRLTTGVQTALRCVYGFELTQDDFGTWNVSQEHLHFDQDDIPSFQRYGSSWTCSMPQVSPVLSQTALIFPVVGGSHPCWKVLLEALKSIRLYELRPEAMRQDCRAKEERLLEPAGGNAANVIAALERHQRSVLQSVTESLGVILPGLKRIGTEARKGMRSFYLEQEGARSIRLETHQLSVGTLRALGVLLALYQQPPPALILIEEPEDSIHVRALQALLEAAGHCAEHTQVVLTSHHPVVLSQPEITVERTRLLVWEGGRSRVYALKPDPDPVSDASFTVGEMLQFNALTLDSQDPLPVECRVESAFFRVEERR